MARREAGSLANASLVGANTVKGPPVETVSASPALTTRSTSVVAPTQIELETVGHFGLTKKM